LDENFKIIIETKAHSQGREKQKSYEVFVNQWWLPCRRSGLEQERKVSFIYT